MANTVNALDFLAAPDRYPVKPIVVLLGDESFLVRESFLRIKKAILDEEDSEFSFTSFEGLKTDWTTVTRELHTVSMFGGDLRLIRVEDADAGPKRGGSKNGTDDDGKKSEIGGSVETSFIGRYRDLLIDYIKKPAKTAVLLLQFKTLPTTTILYRSLNDNVLLIDCRPIPTPKIASWLAGWAKKNYHVSMDYDAAQLLVDRVGDELALLDQELARLALLVPGGGVITTNFISDKVGTWRTQKVWDLLDAVLLGKTTLAIQYLEQLLAAGVEPVYILASFAPTLRKMAAATRQFFHLQKNGERPNLSIVLKNAGFNAWQLPKAETQLKTLGSQRADLLLDLLLQTDYELKGESSLPPRVILEQMIIRLSSKVTR